MKKLAIGCLVVAAIAGAAVVGGGYYLFRQGRAALSQFAELGRVPDLEREVRVKDPFVPPATEELTAAQIDRLMRVQDAIVARLGERAAEFRRKYESLAKKDTATVLDAPALLNAYRDIAAGWMDAKRAQIDALNAVGLSLDEYRWIRHEAYRALGVAYMDLDIARLAEDIKAGRAGQPGEILGSLGPGGPEINRKLIEPIRKKLEQNIALASFGL